MPEEKNENKDNLLEYTGEVNSSIEFVKQNQGRKLRTSIQKQTK